MILEFHTGRCSLCGRSVEQDRLPRFSASDLRSGWGCSCRRRKLAVVGEEAALISIIGAGQIFLRKTRSEPAAILELDE